jgi:hypothetical protein
MGVEIHEKYIKCFEKKVYGENLVLTMLVKNRADASKWILISASHSMDSVSNIGRNSIDLQSDYCVSSQEIGIVLKGNYGLAVWGTSIDIQNNISWPKLEEVLEEKMPQIN